MSSATLGPVLAFGIFIGSKFFLPMTQVDPTSLFLLRLLAFFFSGRYERCTRGQCLWREHRIT